jgi:hypothetical protein
LLAVIGRWQIAQHSQYIPVAPCQCYSADHADHARLDHSTGNAQGAPFAFSTLSRSKFDQTTLRRPLTVADWPRRPPRRRPHTQLPPSSCYGIPVTDPAFLPVLWTSTAVVVRCRCHSASRGATIRTRAATTATRTDRIGHVIVQCSDRRHLTYVLYDVGSSDAAVMPRSRAAVHTT